MASESRYYRCIVCKIVVETNEYESDYRIEAQCPEGRYIYTYCEGCFRLAHAYLCAQIDASEAAFAPPTDRVSLWRERRGRGMRTVPFHQNGPLSEEVTDIADDRSEVRDDVRR